MDNQQKIDLISSLSEFVKSSLTVNDSLVCTVKSYDSATKTCYCVPIADYADIQQVRINPDFNKKGLIIFPKVDSIVLVSFLSDSSAYISMFSEIDEMRLGGDQYGGIAKTNPIAQSLNALENRVNLVASDLLAIATAAAATTTTPVTGASLAGFINAAIANIATPLNITMLSTITNDVVKHGDGIV